MSEASPASLPFPATDTARMVLYCIGMDARNEPVLRPAIVVRTFPDAEYVNLQVFLDGSNDKQYREAALVALNASTAAGANPYVEPTIEECERGMMWRTSVHPGLDGGQYRWPPRS